MEASRLLIGWQLESSTWAILKGIEGIMSLMGRTLAISVFWRRSHVLLLRAESSCSGRCASRIFTRVVRRFAFLIVFALLAL
jgi:hypothetical protein